MDTERAIFSDESSKNHFRVTIFGSARINKNSSVYKEVYEIGKMLGEREIDVVTGGGPGIMEAASTGHKIGRKKGKNESHSIGLGIVLPKEQKFNKGVDVLTTFKRFSNRLDEFMLLSDAIVVAPGGVGTLLELFYSWQLIQTEKISTIPIILMDEHWKGLMEWLKKYPLKQKYFTKSDMNLLFLAKNAKEVIKIIDKTHINYKNGKVKKKYFR